MNTLPLFPRLALCVAGLVLITILSGCGGTPAVSTTNAGVIPVPSPTPPPNPNPTPPPTPTAVISLSSATIIAGQATTLSWQTQNATTVTLNGATVNASGSISVSPSQTTTYTLVANGAGGTQQAVAIVTVTPAQATGIQKVNHIIYMLQENRSFDSYFGQLGAYKAAHGLGLASDVDGLPPNSSNLTGNHTVIPSFHLRTSCTENSDPDWLESHGDFNFADPGSNVFTGTGYVHNGQGQAKHDGFITEVQAASGTLSLTASNLSPIYQGTSNLYLFASPIANPNTYSSLPVGVVTLVVADDKVTKITSAPVIPADPTVKFTIAPNALTPGGSSLTVPNGATPFTITWSVAGAAATMISNRYDQMGRRVMGYYDANDLPFYYSMAASFATSDRWFSPIPSNSIPNRIYLYAATTHGHVHDPGTLNSALVPNIFQLLQNAGVSWKVYYTIDPEVPGVPHTALTRFQPFATNFADHMAPVSQYFTDLQNGTLPAVAFLEEAPGLDEHPGATLPGDISAGNSIQDGALYVSKLIKAFLNSQYWDDGVFILTYDEAGGFYDHVAGQPTVSPDGIAPQDLTAQDRQFIVPQGDFNRTGFRVPLIVVSKFARKSYVSHTVADYTAILKFIEARFLGPGVHLTARDAAQMDMTEFFDFAAPPWTTPPVPPAQPQELPCNYTLLP